MEASWWVGVGVGGVVATAVFVATRLGAGDGAMWCSKDPVTANIARNARG